MIVCVAPNPAVDRFFVAERVEPGRIHRPLAQTQVPGGKGLNVARAAAALGADVHVVALLGGHAGRWIADGLAREEIALTAVWTAAETRSCLSVADGSAGTLTEFYEAAEPVERDTWREFVRNVREQAPRGSWATFSGSLPAAGDFSELIAGSRAALDSRSGGLAAGAALVKLNEDEATQLTGVAEPLAAARALREQTGGRGHASVVTLGGDGAVMVAPDGSSWRGRVDAFGPYPVGSGDAFLAGMVVALERRGDDWQDALRLGLAAGAANAETAGAGRLDRERAEALVRKALVSAVDRP